MARWKAHVEFLLSVSELLFLSLTVEELQGKIKPRCFHEGVVSLSQDFRGKGWSLGNIFGFYKTRLILLSDSANCTVLRAVVLTQYRRVRDRRTDGRNWYSYYSACNANIAACCEKSKNIVPDT